MAKKHKLLLLFFLLTFSCSNADIEPDSVMFRIQNNSTYTFEKIFLPPAEYDKLVAGQTTSYQSFKEGTETELSAYFIKVIIEGENFIMLYDFPTENGKYTIMLNVEDFEKNSLSIEVTKEE